MGTLSPLFFHAIRESHIRRLSRCFPKVCLGLVEDSVDEAWLELHRRGLRGQPLAAAVDERPAVQVPAEFDQTFVRWWLFRVAWCHLRGVVRRRSFRQETGDVDLAMVAVAQSAEQEEGLLLDLQLGQLIPEAARLFGGRYRAGLELALHDRVVLGFSDRDAANANDVPREYVNRAKNWILEQINKTAELPELRAA